MQRFYKKIGDECIIAYGVGENPNKNVNSIKIDSKIEVKIHSALSQLFDIQGRGSYFATKRLIKKIKEYKPDIIHLHNLHGCYINIKTLFKYFSNISTPIVWTLHDCWNFTGHCAHFEYINCLKWMQQCEKCPQKEQYPRSIFLDNSKGNYKTKKKIYNNCKNITFITPSKWLADLQKKSFLKEYKSLVINNGIDLEKFKYIPNNQIKEKFDLVKKFVILGVASAWGEKKGLNYFIELDKMLDNSYKIVLVGVDEKLKKTIPDNILCIPKTNNVEELAELYNMADVFVNPTLQDTFPTTNIEAMACGTPVITFNTGGSPESLNDKCGYIVEKGNISKLCDAIKKCKENNFFSQDCIERSKEFDKKKKYEEYIKIYTKLLEKD